MCWRNKDKNRSLYREAARNGCFIIQMNTTVLSPVADILEVSVLKCIYKKGMFRFTGVFHTLADPGREISMKTLEKNGIDGEALKGSPGMDVIFPLLKGFLGEHPYLISYSSFPVQRLGTLYEEHGDALQETGILDLKEVCKDILCEVDTPDYRFETMEGVFQMEKKDGMVFRELSLMNVLMERLKDDTDGKQKARVYGITYRPGFRGMSRIYVNTTEGTLYYDCLKDKWMPKEKGGSLVRDLDMQHVEDQVFRLAGCKTYAELKRFKGEAGYGKREDH